MALDAMKVEVTIADIDTPSTKEERLFARWFDHCRRAALRKHTWNFATARTTLAASATDPAFGYENAFDLPSDYVRVIGIGESQSTTNYTIEDGQLLCDESGPIDFVYVYDHTAIALWDPLFVDVLILELAKKLGRKLGLGGSDIEQIKDEFQEMQLEAYGVDGQERPPTKVTRSKLRTARRGIRSRRTDIIE